MGLREERRATSLLPLEEEPVMSVHSTPYPIFCMHACRVRLGSRRLGGGGWTHKSIALWRAHLLFPNFYYEYFYLLPPLYCLAPHEIFLPSKRRQRGRNIPCRMMKWRAILGGGGIVDQTKEDRSNSVVHLFSGWLAPQRRGNS